MSDRLVAALLAGSQMNALRFDAEALTVLPRQRGESLRGQTPTVLLLKSGAGAGPVLTEDRLEEALRGGPRSGVRRRGRRRPVAADDDQGQQGPNAAAAPRWCDHGKLLSWFNTRWSGNMSGRATFHRSAATWRSR